MENNGKVNTRIIAARARKQMRQARMETGMSNANITPSSLGAVKKVRVSKQDPTIRTLLELIN